MWKYILLTILCLTFVPIILITLAYSFIYMDATLLNPANWDVGLRQLCAIYAGVVLFATASTAIL